MHLLQITMRREVGLDVGDIKRHVMSATGDSHKSGRASLKRVLKQGSLSLERKKGPWHSCWVVVHADVLSLYEVRQCMMHDAGACVHRTGQDTSTSNRT